MYAIVGATGKTGQPLAEALLEAGQKVRAIGRSEERLEPLVDKGAEPFVGSVSDPKVAAEAFAGATAVYSLLPPRYAAEDFRATQKKFSEAITQGIIEADVKYVVNLSSVGAQHSKGTGPIAGLRKHEDRLGELAGVNVLNLRPGYFMENFFMSIDTIRKMGVVGTPIRSDLPIAMIAARDISDVAARRLLELDFSGKTHNELLGERDLTLTEATRALGRAIDNDDLGYVEFPYEDARAAMLDVGISESTASVFTEMYHAFNDDLVVATEPRSAQNTTPTSIEEFASVFAQVYGS